MSTHTHPSDQTGPSPYRTHYSDDEIARIIQSLPEPGSLNAEIELTRILIDRIMARIKSTTAGKAATTEQFATLVKLSLDATGRLAILMRTNRLLSGESSDRLAQHIAGALDEISQQIGMNL